jgi:O-antigen/teichoic acid export membrane protein
MEESVQFKKNFIWNILGTGFNAFNSLFFLIAVTRINGVINAGIFTIAFSTACIIYVVGIYAGRIFQVTEQNKNITDKDFFVSRIITTILMMVAVLVFVLLKRYEIYKASIFILLTLYKALEAFADVLYGILQKNEQLDKAGKSLFMKSLLSVVGFVIVDLITKNLIVSIISIILLNIIIIILYDFRMANKHFDIKEKAKKESIIKIFKSGFYTFAIAFLGLYILNAPKYAIDTYLEEEFQTIFGIIVMPATVVGLVAQFLIHPFLNKIVDLYENKKMKELQKLSLKLVFAIIIFGVVASVLAYFIGTQILGIIYGLDLHLYKVGLLLIIIAATMYTIGTIYSSILTSIRETFSQFIIYIIVSIFALIISNLATKYGLLNGAILSYLSIMSLQFLMYTIYANIKIAKKEN